MKKIYIISGELSGEQYAAEIINALYASDKEVEVRAWGGPAVKKTKASLARDISQTSFMGFVELFKNINKIISNFSFCKRDILDFNPDKILLIDYAGFNMRIAKWASSKGYEVDYFIAPKTWAWHSSRSHKIAKYVSHLYCIFPFEVDFFNKYGVRTSYVGNPVLNRINEYSYNKNFRKDNQLTEKPIIALLPGSRKQEINNLLDVMLSVIDDYKDYQFCIAKPTHLPSSYYRLALHKSVKIIENQTYDLVKNAKLALVCSGTATLEVALLDCPQIVCYKTSKINAFITKKLINIKYISLVNIIANQEFVPELIQDNCNTDTLKDNIARMLLAIESNQLPSFLESDYGITPINYGEFSPLI